MSWYWWSIISVYVLGVVLYFWVAVREYKRKRSVSYAKAREAAQIALLSPAWFVVLLYQLYVRAKRGFAFLKELLSVAKGNHGDRS